MSKPLPFERIYDLSDLSAAGAEVTIELNPEQRAKLAAWLEGQAAVDRVAQAAAELSARGLTV